MRVVRSVIFSAVLTVASIAGGLAATPAHACFGEPCDSLCDTINTLNDKLPPKLQLTDCQLR